MHGLWFEHVNILLLSILLFITLIIVRFVSDLYGCTAGLFEYSLYYPFDLITTSITKMNISKRKQIQEEIIDFTIEFILNILGIILTVYVIIRMKRKKWTKRRIELEALRIDVIRRGTV